MQLFGAQKIYQSGNVNRKKWQSSCNTIYAIPDLQSRSYSFCPGLGGWVEQGCTFLGWFLEVSSSRSMASRLATSASPGNLVEIPQPTQDQLMKHGRWGTEVSVWISHQGDSDTCWRCTALSSCSWSFESPIITSLWTLRLVNMWVLAPLVGLPMNKWFMNLPNGKHLSLWKIYYCT